MKRTNQNKYMGRSQRQYRCCVPNKSGQDTISSEGDGLQIGRPALAGKEGKVPHEPENASVTQPKQVIENKAPAAWTCGLIDSSRARQLTPAADVGKVYAERELKADVSRERRVV